MKRGTIVLTPFPFSNLSSQKVRPALVVSRSNLPGNDVILAFITSVPATQSLQSDLTISTADPDFALTGLKKNSIVKLDKLVTIDQSVLLGALGDLSARHLQLADAKLRYVLGLK